MSAKKSAEQIIVARNDLNWTQLRALLLLFGMEENPVSDFGPVEGTEIKTGDLSPKSTEFPDFDTFFENPKAPKKRPKLFSSGFFLTF